MVFAGFLSADKVDVQSHILSENKTMLRKHSGKFFVKKLQPFRLQQPLEQQEKAKPSPP